MNVTTHHFEQQTAKTLHWKPNPISMDQADEPDWAVWETLCRTYRITYFAKTNTYAMSVVHIKRILATTHSQWKPFGKSQSSLEAAMHLCEQHRKGKDARNG